MGTLTRKATQFYFYLPSKWGSFVREANFLLKTRHHCERAMSSRKANKKSQKMYPIEIMVEETWSFPLLCARIGRVSFVRL